MNATVNILTILPETLHEYLKQYLEQHPDYLFTRRSCVRLEQRRIVTFQDRHRVN